MKFGARAPLPCTHRAPPCAHCAPKANKNEIKKFITVERVVEKVSLLDWVLIIPIPITEANLVSIQKTRFDQLTVEKKTLKRILLHIGKSFLKIEIHHSKEIKILFLLFIFLVFECYIYIP